MNIMNLAPICVCVGLFVFLVIAAIFSAPSKNKILENTDPADKTEWLYSNFLEKIYDALFSKKDPVELSKKLGLEYDKYMLNCQIINKTPNMKKETMLRIIGVFGFVLGAALCLLLSFNLIPFFIGVALYFFCVLRITKSAQKEAESKKIQLLVEFPRFVDLLQSALDIGLPVDVAIAQTAETVPCIISDDINLSFAQMEIGAESWQGALEELAHKYEIDLLSDFVLDLITAYNKGVSITQTIARKSYEIRQSALLRAKERTAKMNTTILIPIMCFKIIPLLGIMLVPIVMQIAGTFVG